MMRNVIARVAAACAAVALIFIASCSKRSADDGGAPAREGNSSRTGRAELPERIDSSLARASDCVLEVAVVAEGGPLGLAPRASILSEILALQVLSVELQARKDFSRADYHRRHPSGKLGQLSR